MTDSAGAPWHDVGWYVAVALGLLGGPGFLAFGRPVWNLPNDNPLLVWTLVAVFLVCSVALLWVRKPSGGRSGRVRWAASVSAIGLVVVYLEFLLMNDPVYSRSILISGSTLFVAGLLLPSIFSVSWRLVLVSLVSAIAAGSFLLAVDVWVIGAGSKGPGLGLLRSSDRDSRLADGRATMKEVIATNRHTVVATFYSDRLPPSQEPKVLGGGLATDPADGGLYLARARGQIYRVSWDDSARLRLTDTGLRVPVNNDAFETDTGEQVNAGWFRVADIVVVRNGSSVRLIASHHFWKHDDRCFVVRLSSLTLSERNATAARESDVPSWRTVFESRPCLPIEHGARGDPFAGLQAGGSVAALGSDSVLLTVGDHQFDGWNKTPGYIQDPDAHYGKTVLIDLGERDNEVFTTGHRNPQGLTVDRRGRIWATEHGPEGGDELNLLRRGGNYGWPYHTYGTEYGSVTWPLSDSVRRDDYVFPVYAWVPSIGVSETVAVRNTSFVHWRDDLLVAALRGQSLWRLRLDGDRVTFAESIPIGERVRDVVATPDGAFVLWTDSKSLVRLRPDTARDRGSVVFASRCAGCHGTRYGKETGIGPSLRGLFDRPVASAEAFEYSSALRELDGKWSEGRLDAFLADPDSVVPGTTMAFEGIDDPAARKSVIEYLRSLN